MGTPATVLEARGVKKPDKGMASQSMVTLFSAFFVACVVGVTFAYPSNIQDILEHENAENTARIEKVLSHFSPEEPQQYDKDIEKRNSKSFSAWGGKRGGQGSQFSAWGGKRGGQGSQFSAWVVNGVARGHNSVLGEANDQIGLIW